MESCCAVCFLGRTPKCKTPSVDVQSVPRFTLLEHYGSQVHKKNHQRLLVWEVSVMQQRRCFATYSLIIKVFFKFLKIFHD